MPTMPVRRDRRHARRDDTLAEIVDVAVQVMTEHGAGGLSLGEVARRMGMQTPSLYGYFASKNAVYDAVFAAGWRGLREAMWAEQEAIEANTETAELLLAMATHFVRWSVEHPAHSELMAWRPVPDYEPSADAYATAVEMWSDALAAFARLQADGRLRPDLPTEHLLKAWTVLVSGVITQQLANAPHESFADGAFTTLLPDVVAMFAEHYAVPHPSSSHAARKERS